MMLPCSHIFASFVLYTNAVMGRSKIVIMETFEPYEALRLQEAEKVSVLLRRAHDVHAHAHTP